MAFLIEQRKAMNAYIYIILYAQLQNGDNGFDSKSNFVDYHFWNLLS